MKITYTPEIKAVAGIGKIVELDCFGGVVRVVSEAVEALPGRTGKVLIELSIYEADRLRAVGMPGHREMEREIIGAIGVLADRQRRTPVQHDTHYTSTTTRSKEGDWSPAG